MKTRRLAVTPLVGALIALGHGPLVSQGVWDELEGERVRITYESNGPHVIEGFLREVTGTAFLVAPSIDRVVPVPRDQVTDFRVLRGQERQWKRGLGVGAASGAVAGTLTYLLIVGLLDSAFGGSGSVSPGVFAYTAVGALYGAGIGLGIGALFRRDRWEPVFYRDVMPSLQVIPGGRVSIGVSLPLRR